MITKEENRSLAYFMQALLFILIILAIKNENYWGIIFGSLSLFITFIPAILKRKWNITLPWTLNFLILLALLLHEGGLVGNWYHILHPYFFDKFTHLIGSITIALLGFTSVLIIDRYTKIELSKKSIVFFVVIFTMAVGAFWEIIEFASDNFLGTNAQYDGLNGTMLDLVFDLAGGIVAGVISYYKMKKGKEKFIDVLLGEIGLKRVNG